VIVSSDDAFFADPVVRMGIPGVEYFAHPWVIGPRAAKEILFTGDRFTAQRAYEWGMVNRVVPRESLEAETFAIAERIATLGGSAVGTPGALVKARSWDDYSIGRADAIAHLGALDVVYQGYGITDTTTYAMTPAFEYFTRSTDGGDTWTKPVKVGAEAGTMSLSEWWIDSSIGIDSAGNLYVSWDTQTDSSDTGWLAYSTNRGKTWSPAIQATPDSVNAPHIMEVAGGGPGIAYVGSQTSSDPRGYATFLRAFSTTRGWLSDPFMVSNAFGDTSVWPGDTFGISTLSPTSVVMSWGSAVPSAYQKKSDIFATTVGVKLP